MAFRSGCLVIYKTMTCGISSISAPSYEEVTASEMFCHKPPSNWGWEELDSGMKTKGQTRLGTGQANPVNAWPLPPRPEQLQAALLQAEPLQSPAPPLPRPPGEEVTAQLGEAPRNFLTECFLCTEPDHITSAGKQLSWD